MGLYRQEYIPPIQARSPRGQREGKEVQKTPKAPSVVIKVEYDKKNPNIQKIVPTRDSVRALAAWYKKNGIKTDTRVTVSGIEIGERELPPLFTQGQNFDEKEFQKWAFSVMGAGMIAEMPEPELPILRKIYGNLGTIEVMRNEKRKNDIKKGTITALTKMELDSKMTEILDERLGNPLEFKEDIEVMNTRIEDEKEYGYLSEEAIDYMFGCIINAHIFNKGKKLTLVNNQPKVETGNPIEDAQWSGVLDTLHFGIKKGSIITAKDNQSKIADYIGAYTYHHVSKDLTGYYGTLSQKIVGSSPDVHITQERIAKSNLSPSEKSFISQWLNQEGRLGDIQSRQRDFVERATENMRGKSAETIKRDMNRDAIGTISKISPLMGGAIIAGILGGILAMIWGKDSKLAKFVLTIAAGLGVIGIAKNIGGVSKSFQAWATDNGNTVTQAPRRTVNTGDSITDAWRDIQLGFEKKWDRFSAMFTTSNDWRKLILDDRIGPKIVNKYPTGALLAVLNPDPDSKFNEQGKWRGTSTQEKEIKEILDKLTPEEKETLNTMLQETWKKYKDAQGTALNHTQLRTGTIKDMIDSIDINYGWTVAFSPNFPFLQGKIGSAMLRPAYWFGETEKATALTEFTKRPARWRDTKIGDLMVSWFTTGAGARTDLPTGWRISRKSTNLINTIPPTKLDAMKHIITKIWEENKPCDPTKTLGELLTKEA